MSLSTWFVSTVQECTQRNPKKNIKKYITVRGEYANKWAIKNEINALLEYVRWFCLSLSLSFFFYVCVCGKNSVFIVFLEKKGPLLLILISHNSVLFTFRSLFPAFLSIPYTNYLTLLSFLALIVVSLLYEHKTP